MGKTKGNLPSPPRHEGIDGNTAAGSSSQKVDGYIEFVEDEDGEGTKQTRTEEEARPIKKQKYAVTDTMAVGRCFMDYLQSKDGSLKMLMKSFFRACCQTCHRWYMTKVNIQEKGIRSNRSYF